MSENIKIPKIIHYCWFGKNDKPELIKRCIESWNNILNDYEIIEWNEENFDINQNDYVREAYENKKYAFVSDYARVSALYKYGGIYLDTDVEVFKKFDDILENDSFWGFEQGNYIATSTIGSKPGNKLIKIFLDSYEGKKFMNKDGSFDELTNVSIITEIIKNYGIKQDGKFQKIKGIATFYPQDYLSPYDYINCRSFKSSNTYCMHHFYKSWLPPKAKLKSNFKIIVSKFIGGDNIAKIRAMFQ